MKCKVSNYLAKLIILCFLMVFQLGSATAQTELKLDSLFRTLYKAGDFNGCVLIAENGKPIYQKSFGYADFTTKRLLDNQTMFELASVSKQFTAMAIMQLHQAKKLSYDDDITQYLPQIPYKHVTINNLLHHTSGIPDFLGWNGKQIDTTKINYDNDILTSLVRNAPPLEFKPGERFAYSNTNYVLLALIVERISGMTFGDYMNQFIFSPLQMTHTKIYHRRADSIKEKDYAMGYIYDPYKKRFIVNDSIPANHYQYYFDGIAGPYGISSNTTDMLKWDQALYTDKLVSKKEQEAAYQPSKLNNGKIASLMGLPYGFGWLILPEKDYTGKRYMHTGGYPGYMTLIARYPDKDKTIIILTNMWNVINFGKLFVATENILFNKPFVLPPPIPFQKTVTLTPAQLNAIEGTYVLNAAHNIKLTISLDAGQAYAQLTGQIKVEIYPKDELNFFYTMVPATIKFIKNKDGVIRKLILSQNGRELRATKE